MRKDVKGGKAETNRLVEDQILAFRVIVDVSSNLQGRKHHDAVEMTPKTYSAKCADLGVKFVKSLVVLCLVGILLGL